MLRTESHISYTCVINRFSHCNINIKRLLVHGQCIKNILEFKWSVQKLYWVIVRTSTMRKKAYCKLCHKQKIKYLLIRIGQIHKEHKHIIRWCHHRGTKLSCELLRQMEHIHHPLLYRFILTLPANKISLSSSHLSNIFHAII